MSNNSIGNQDKDNKLFFKLLKKQKKDKRRKLIRLILILIILLLGLIIYERIYPGYEEYKKKSFEILTNTDINSFKRMGTTRVYDKDNNLIGEVGTEKYEYVSIKDISDFVINGYIAKEDRNFYLHGGVDIKANIRALYALIKNDGVITQGASTITQQVVKNYLLTPEQTFKRKFIEMMLAYDMEKEFNKAQIMEFYCNGNYYGNGCYGVEGASEYYFGKTASDIDLAEAAMLVATSNLPNEYNPVVDYEKCMTQKVDVLDRMLEQGYITEDEYIVAVNETPEIVQKSYTVNPDNYQTTYAIHCAAIKVMELKGFEFKYKFDSQETYEEYINTYNSKYNAAIEEVRNSGYEIYTSLDKNAQDLLQKSIDDNLKEFTEKENDIYKLQSAAVCVDNATGMVIAIVGGREKEGSFNRGYQATRQSGSSIKPLLDYAPAINEGVVSPGSIIEDKPINYNGYAPHNAYSGYAGKTTVRLALLRSINTVAVQLLNETGIDNCYSYLTSMKFSTLTYADSISMAISLGGFTNGVTVADMAKGYSTIANNGKYINEDCIISMSNYNKSITYKAKNKSTEVYSPETSFMMQDMMQQLFEEKSGAGNKYKKSKQHYAGKTGTSNNTKDVWFCGFSPYYTTAVWIGYDNPAIMTTITSSTYPTKIWTEYMENIHDGLDEKDYDIPKGIMLSNGKKEKKPDYYKDVYKLRPSGWDYISLALNEKLEKHKEEMQNKEILQNAIDAVEKFEDFEIDSIEDAQNIVNCYNEALNCVDLVADEKEKKELMSRIAFKYDVLNENVLKEWNDAIDEYNKTLQVKKKEEIRTKSQVSIEKAKEKRNAEKVDRVVNYINWLNDRTLYTEYVKDTIEDAKESLQECEDLPEYDSLKDQLEEAIEYVNELPVQVNNDNTEVEEE